MKPPPRLLDDADVTPELRRDLQRVASAPSDYDVAAGLAGLQAAIGGSIVPATGSGHAAQSAAASHGAGSALGSAAASKSVGLLGTIGAKLVASAVAGAALAGSIVAVTQSNTQPSATSRHAAVTQAPAATPQAPINARPVIDTSPAIANAATPISAPANSITLAAAEGSAVSARTLHAADKNAASSGWRREIAQLASIKAALEHDPATAYRLAQVGHREFGNSALRQEREALAIIALTRLDRHAEAERRARDFIALYPESPLRERVERSLKAEAE